MIYRLEFEKDAILDIRHAFEWYEKQKEGLGHFFLDELEECYQKICSYPLYYTAVNEYFRRIKVNRVPYLIIYEIEDDMVIVNTVLHTSRDRKF